MEELCSILQALANPVRICAVRSLQSGELGPEKILEAVQEVEPDIYDSRLRYHLYQLKEAGIISAREQGRQVFYSIDREVLNRLSDEVLSLAVDGEISDELQADARESAYEVGLKPDVVLAGASE